MVTSNYSGVGTFELATDGIVRHAAPGARVTYYSAAESCPKARAALISHSPATRPAHLFGDITERLLVVCFGLWVAKAPDGTYNFRSLPRANAYLLFVSCRNLAKTVERNSTVFFRLGPTVVVSGGWGAPSAQRSADRIPMSALLELHAIEVGGPV